MLQVRQFSSAEGKGRSSHPKSGTVSLKGPGPDQTQLLSLSKFDKKYFYYENFKQYKKELDIVLRTYVVSTGPKFKTSASWICALNKWDQILSFFWSLEWQKLRICGLTHFLGLYPTHAFIGYFITASSNEVKTPRTCRFSTTYQLN